MSPPEPASLTPDRPANQEERSVTRPALGESRLVVTAQTRQTTRLDELTLSVPPSDPPIAELTRLAREAKAGAELWLVGGEPSLRADLPALVADLAEGRPGAIALCSDGLALAEPAAVTPLVQGGLKRVRLILHSPRPEAHDWLVKQPGAARRVIRGLRSCAAAGLAVELQATITRPTMSHLADLVELACHLGIGDLHLRRLVARGPAADHTLMLAARFALLERHLGDAVAAAAKGPVRLYLHGYPPCTVPSAEGCRVPANAVRWLLPKTAEWQPVNDWLAEPTTLAPCQDCPGLPSCGGAPADYLSQFGSRELSRPPASGR
jgi:MoaA/NifB/PqqE/SkfB family radical SAM enzyme